MLGGATSIVLFLISIFILILIVRAILSWFPGTMYIEFGRIVLMATEWYLAPIRRVIPPAGGLDISFLVGIVTDAKAPAGSAERHSALEFALQLVRQTTAAARAAELPHAQPRIP